MKKYLQKIWAAIKRWWLAMLVGIGLITAPIIYAEVVNFTYTRSTTRIDGSPLPLAEIATTRLYCDGSLLFEEPGADENFSQDLGLGTHSCYATHVDTFGLESDPSNTVIKIVNPALPSPPVLDP